MKDKISLREWAAAEKSAKPDNNASASQGFWRLDLVISEVYEHNENIFDRSYIIKTSSVERAIAVVEVELYKSQEARIAELEKIGKRADKASYMIKIRSVSPMKIDYVVPVDFTIAHNKKENA